MALNLLLVTLEEGLMYAVLALGVYITYSILDFPDLSVDGTVLLGAVSFAVLAKLGINPWLCMVIAFVIGCLAGAVTGILHVKFKIRPLLCGILVYTGLITVNMIIAVVGNGGDFSGDGALTTVSLGRKVSTIFKSAPADWIPLNINGFSFRKIIVLLIVAVLAKLILDWYLSTKNGLLLRATGNNTQYVSMLGKDPGNSKIIGLALGNGFAAFAGSMIAQSQGNANQGMGVGMVVTGLASVIIGLSVFRKVKFLRPTTMVIFGSIIYKACLSIATSLGVPSSYNKLLMALLFTIALVSSGEFKRITRRAKNA